MRDLTEFMTAVRDLLKTDRPVTAGGVCYLLRGANIPPVIAEAEAALHSLAVAGLAEVKGQGEFGPEYVKPFVRHTCNAARPGQPLPWGRKAPEGECARCDELRAGAAPREAPHGIREAKASEADDARRSAEIRQHFDSGEHAAKCGPISTCYDW
jgi:hypothetical protein